MKKTILLLSLLSFAACEPKKEILTDVAARASGRYAVVLYTINGDTLYTGKGINKLGLSEFYIVVNREKADSVQIVSSYQKTGDAGSINYLKDVGIDEANGVFQLSHRSTSASSYESRITGNTFYERTSLGGPGVAVIPPGYLLKAPNAPNLKGITILAKK